MSKAVKSARSASSTVTCTRSAAMPPAACTRDRTVVWLPRRSACANAGGHGRAAPSSAAAVGRRWLRRRCAGCQTTGSAASWRSMNVRSGRGCPTGATPPMACPVAVRTCCAVSRWSVRAPHWGARWLVSTWCAPLVSTSTGSSSAMKTRLLAMAATGTSSAAAACAAVWAPQVRRVVVGRVPDVDRPKAGDLLEAQAGVQRHVEQQRGAFAGEWARIRPHSSG